MWKRIQTLYLVISTGLVISMFFSRFATETGGTGDDVTIRYYERTSYLVMLIMLLITNLLALCAYKRPMLQARICIITGLITLGFQIWLGIDFFRYKELLTFSITMLFPLLASFLNFVAGRCALIDGFTIQAVHQKRYRTQKK